MILRPIVAAFVGAVALLLTGDVAAQGNVCCHACLNTLGPSLYDPSDFAQCDKKKPGCCFCTKELTLSAPSYALTQTAGEWQKVSWPGVDKVTMVTVADDTVAHPQTTTLLPGVQQDASGSYLFCIDNPGKIIFRGWGPIANTYPSNCTAISTELHIKVTAASGSASKCADSKPGGSITKKPSSSGSDSQAGGTKTPPNTSTTCSPARGYVQNGECFCLSDYAGPPSCDGMATWKILVSIGGGLAALFSIVVSVRQFMLFQKRKKDEEALATAVDANQSSKNFDTMYAMPAASHQYYDGLNAVNTTPSRRTDGSRPSDLARPSIPDGTDPRFQPRESKEYTL